MPSSLTIVGNTLYFLATPVGTLWPRLWAYDGSHAPDLIDMEDPYSMIAYKGKLYFNAFVSGPDNKMIVVQPGINVPQVVTTSTYSAGFPFASSMITVGGKMYFISETDTGGNELYSYDGIIARQVCNVAAGHAGIRGPLCFYKGAIYFAGPTSASGDQYQLYRYDTLTASASLAAMINPGGEADISDLNVYRGKLYFVANTSAAGHELWVYDGVSATMVADLSAGLDDGILWSEPYSNVNTMKVFNGSLYFTGNDGNHGWELYKLNDATGIQRVVWAGDVVIHPNPATTSTTVSATLNSAQVISVALCDIYGREVYTTGAQFLPAGKCDLDLPMSTLTTGQYFYRIYDGSSRLLANGTIVKQ